MPGYVSEKILIEFWRRQVWGERLLTTENGTPVTVVYPGRLNDGRGGDYCDVVLTLGDCKVTGNIELHTITSDWQNHGHHLDTHYNDVVLHVVYHNNRHAFTVRQDGTSIPVLSLEKAGIPATSRLKKTSSRLRPCQTAGFPQKKKYLIGVLEAAGDRRFFMKSEQFTIQLAQIDAGQVLFQGIMEGLGYAKNQTVFRELSKRLTLAALQSEAKSAITDIAYFVMIFNRLLAAAGIPPNQPGSIPGEANPVTAPVPLRPDFWQRFRIRPNNAPVVRLAAMACLLVRYRGSSLLGGLINVIKELPEDEKSPMLENAVVISREYYSSLAASSLPGCLTPLGSSRAGEITVNIILPFAHAYGQTQNDLDLSRKAAALYHRQDKTAGNNLERHMIAQLGLSSGIIHNARLQQGLLHIFRQYCTQGRCRNCDLSQFKVGEHIQV